MILYPPIRFDANEWFVIVVSVLVWLGVWVIRRRLSPVTLLIIWSFNCMLAFTADFTIGVPPVDMYDFNDRPQYEWIDVVLYMFTYPPAAFFFVTGYELWRLDGWRLTLYILFFAAVTTVLEAIAAFWFHVFNYHYWKLIYSFPTYIVIYGLNLAVYRFLQRYGATKPNVSENQ